MNESIYTNGNELSADSFTVSSNSLHQRKETKMKINVLQIIMTEESVHDKRLGNEISSLIQHINEQGYLLQHSEGLAEAIDADPLKVKQ